MRAVLRAFWTRHGITTLVVAWALLAWALQVAWLLADQGPPESDEWHHLTKAEIILSAWQEGEADKMYEISVQSSLDHPELEAQLNRLLDDRNVAMVKKIDSYLATADTYFVVVGALHMGGPRGILRLLGKDHDVVQLHHCSE